MRKLECPGCGANLTLQDDNREFAFCEFCGAKITLDDYRSSYHVVDEARLKEAETEQMIRKKQLEWAEKQEVENEKKKRLKIKTTLILGAICVVSILIAVAANSEFFFIVGGLVFIAGFYILESDYFNINKDTSSAIADVGKVRVPGEIAGFINKNYAVIKSELSGAGFTNIKCIPLNDLTTGLLNKPGTVESITIDGIRINGGGKAFPPHADVIITYHSMAEQNVGSIIENAKKSIKEQFKD